MPSSKTPQVSELNKHAPRQERVRNWHQGILSNKAQNPGEGKSDQGMTFEVIIQEIMKSVLLSWGAVFAFLGLSKWKYNLDLI